jgi:adenylate cyclase
MNREDYSWKVEDRVIVFTDVHNYSIAVSGLTNGPSVALQEMYETLGDIIVEYQGEILKYMGDAILCIFPKDSEHSVIEMALKLCRAFSAMEGWQGLPGNPELEIGIGSGNIAIGIFGHRTHQQKDVFGEEMNRVATIGHHRGITITERVHDRIKQHYATHRLPDMSVKWQSDPLKVWEILEE